MIRPEILSRFAGDPPAEQVLVAASDDHLAEERGALKRLGKRTSLQRRIVRAGRARFQVSVLIVYPGKDTRS